MNRGTLEVSRGSDVESQQPTSPTSSETAILCNPFSFLLPYQRAPSENSSGRCAGFLFSIVIFLVTFVLLVSRQHIFHVAEEYDTVEAVTSVLDVLGLSFSGDPNECTLQTLTLQSNGKTDTTYCGVNSKNVQGCTAGFYQPYDGDVDGPAEVCPDGYWCPESFVCKVPCPKGAYCMAGTRRVEPDNSIWCEFNKSPTTIYNESLTCADTISSHSRRECPGAENVYLCPKGKYCPSASGKRECTSGHFCPLGTFRPYKCFLGHLACPDKGMTFPNVFPMIGVMMGLALVITFLLYVVYKRINNKTRIIKKREAEFQGIKKEKEQGAQKDVREKKVSASTVNSDSMNIEEGGYTMKIWLFMGSDLSTHTVILTCSILTMIVSSILFAVLPKRLLPITIFDKEVSVSFCTILISIPFILMSMMGVGLLRRYSPKKEYSNNNDGSDETFTVINENCAEEIKNTSLKSLSDKKGTKVNIEVIKLGMKIGEKEILSGVDGKFDAANITAIMGPSGAGKTTFMNVLCGRATYGTPTGEIKINGHKSNIEAISRLVGFVPQDDTMHRELTVREVLLSYAMLRLPQYYDKARIEGVVEDVMHALKLESVSESKIGDETTRGISGGQRKRVNIGMEMVADPSLLFLDEPTSGLDSTTTTDVMIAFQALTKKGANIIAVLHQPSYEVFKMFTQVLLLGRGGRTVFMGPVSGAEEYFKTELKYENKDALECKNPADFYMNVVAGDLKNPGGDTLTLGVNELYKRFEEYSNKPREDESTNERQQNVFSMEEYATLEPAGFSRALKVHIVRSATQHMRFSENIAYDILLHCGTGAFLGLSNQHLQLGSLSQALSMYALGIGMTIGLASLRVFGSERIIFWREAATGSGMNLSPLPYFVAKIIVEIPRITVLSFCITVCFYPFLRMLCEFGSFFGMTMMAAWAISGYAYLLSIVFDQKTAQLIFVIICLVHLLYSGITKRLKSMSDLEYGLSWTSPNRWLVEDLFVCHTSQLSPVYGLPPSWYASSSHSLIGYLLGLTYTDRNSNLNHDSRLYWNILMNFWLGFVLRFLAFVGLCYTNRKQLNQPPLWQSIARFFDEYEVIGKYISLEARILKIIRVVAFLKRRAGECCFNNPKQENGNDDNNPAPSDVQQQSSNVNAGAEQGADNGVQQQSSDDVSAEAEQGADNGVQQQSSDDVNAEAEQGADNGVQQQSSNVNAGAEQGADNGVQQQSSDDNAEAGQGADNGVQQQSSDDVSAEAEQGVDNGVQQLSSDDLNAEAEQSTDNGVQQQSSDDVNAEGGQSTDNGVQQQSSDDVNGDVEQALGVSQDYVAPHSLENTTTEELPQPPYQNTNNEGDLTPTHVDDPNTSDI